LGGRPADPIPSDEEETMSQPTASDRPAPNAAERDPAAPLPDWSRRGFLATGLLTTGGLAALGLPRAARAAPAQGAAGAAPAPRVKAPPAGRSEFAVTVVSSANGLEATRLAYQRILAGEDVLTAVVAGVNLVEDDPEDVTVGYGGLPNEEGVVELDAAVMHGPTHRAGAVAALRGIKNPSKVARLVMEQTDHVLLVGEGALRFARAHGFEEENLLTEKARKIWLYWKQSLSAEDDWVPPPPELLDPAVREHFGLGRPTGTIHCAGIDPAGNVSCVTTTSGLAFKIPGRVGDSPIIGAGLYADNAVGTCGSTGRGEANLQNLCSFAAVELMRNGMSAREAGLEVLRRVAATTEPRLRDAEGRPDFGLRFYLIGPRGEPAGVSMWGPAKYSVTDPAGTRHEECAALYTR
jgi:N4-(beta-N-acetylglucosaminyl)-L-asparaginase